MEISTGCKSGKWSKFQIVRETDESDSLSSHCSIFCFFWHIFNVLWRAGVNKLDIMSRHVPCTCGLSVAVFLVNELLQGDNTITDLCFLKNCNRMTLSQTQLRGG